MHASFKNLYSKYNFDLSVIVNMSNARKMMRWAKSLIEYKKFNDIIGKKDSMPLIKLVLKLIPPLSRFFMWIFDTLVILSKVKVLPNVDQAYVTYRYALFWTISNLVSLLGALYELYDIARETAKLQAKKMIAT